MELHLAAFPAAELRYDFKLAAWFAQLVERRTAVREVEGSSPRLDQHSESWNNWGERAAFVIISANG